MACDGLPPPENEPCTMMAGAVLSGVWRRRVRTYSKRVSSTVAAPRVCVSPSCSVCVAVLVETPCSGSTSKPTPLFAWLESAHS